MGHIAFFIVFLPIAAGILLLFFRSRFAKILALGISIAELVLTVWVVINYKSGLGFQFCENIPWLNNWGINLEFGIDGINLLLILLTAIAIPIIMLASWHKQYHNFGLMHGMTLVLQGALMGVYLSLNIFVYYLFWEMVLIPAYLIILLWGGERRMRVTLKFFIYTFAGSIFMFVAILYLYKMTPGNHSFSYSALSNLQLTGAHQIWPFLAFMLAFMIKTPIFPFHTWQPETYTQAPAAGSMILGGLMSKMGLFSILRWVFPIFPLAVKDFAPYIMWIAIGGLIYASIIALQQKNIKTLFAFSSMAHVGMIAAGLFSLNAIAIQGALFQMFSHGITIIALFFVADIFKTRLESQRLTSFGGIKSQAPVFSAFYLVVLFASIGLPLTSNFVGEFLIITGLTGTQIWFGATAGISIVLGAVYMLTSFKTSMLGEPKDAAKVFSDLNLREKIVFTFLLAIIFIAGIFPTILLKLTEGSINELLMVFK